MWHKYKFFILSGIALFVIGVLETLKPKEVIWLESYSRHDKIPYGCHILYELLQDWNTDRWSIAESSLATNMISDSNVNYLLINDQINLGKEDINALLQYIENGNQALIAARTLPDALLDTLDIKVAYDYHNATIDSLGYYLAGDTVTYFGPTRNIVFRNYFEEIGIAQPLGYRSDSLANFIGMNIGEGRLFIHLAPSTFTNIFVLTDDNHRYLCHMMSFLPQTNRWVWDEHYKARKQHGTKSPMAEVMKRDGLRQAVYISLLGVLIYMLFASKRRQRAIPVVPPKLNTTVDFVETMGQLYYNESDNKDIGKKRVSYFLADIRDRYRLDTSLLDKEFCHRLSSLSGVNKDDVDKLIANFKVMNSVDVVLDDRLAEQDRLIDNFYKIERGYGK